MESPAPQKWRTGVMSCRPHDGAIWRFARITSFPMETQRKVGAKGQQAIHEASLRQDPNRAGSCVPTLDQLGRVGVVEPNCRGPGPKRRPVLIIYLYTAT